MKGAATILVMVQGGQKTEGAPVLVFSGTNAGKIALLVMRSRNVLFPPFSILFGVLHGGTIASHCSVGVV